MYVKKTSGYSQNIVQTQKKYLKSIKIPWPYVLINYEIASYKHHSNQVGE